MWPFWLVERCGNSFAVTDLGAINLQKNEKQVLERGSPSKIQSVSGRLLRTVGDTRVAHRSVLHESEDGPPRARAPTARCDELTTPESHVPRANTTYLVIWQCLQHLSLILVKTPRTRLQFVL